MRRLTYWFILSFIFVVSLEDMVVFPNIGTIAKTIGILTIVIGTFAILTKGQLRIHTFNFVSLFFVVWSWLTLCWAVSVEAALVRTITYTGLWLVTFVIYQFVNTEINCERLMLAYVLGAWVSALATIFQFFSGVQVFYARYTAPGFNPNTLAFYLVFGIPFAWYLGLKRQSGILVRTIAWGFIPIAVWAVLLSGSRSGVVGCALALLYVVSSICRSNMKMLLFGSIPMIAMVALIWRFVPSATYARLATIPQELFYGTLNLRTLIWRAGVEVFSQTPFIGVGAGNFALAVAPILGEPMAPHNVFLSIAVEAGLVGIITWILMLAAAFLGILKTSFSKRALWGTLFIILVLVFSVGCWEWRKGSWIVMLLAAIHMRRGKQI